MPPILCDICVILILTLILAIGMNYSIIYLQLVVPRYQKCRIPTTKQYGEAQSSRRSAAHWVNCDGVYEKTCSKSNVVSLLGLYSRGGLAALVIIRTLCMTAWGGSDILHAKILHLFTKGDTIT